MQKFTPPNVRGARFKPPSQTRGESVPATPAPAEKATTEPTLPTAPVSRSRGRHW
jgi:hypothetical protein